MTIHELIEELKAFPPDAEVSQITLNEMRAVRVVQLSINSSLAAYLEHAKEDGLDLARHHLRRLEELLEQGLEIQRQCGQEPKPEPLARIQ